MDEAKEVKIPLILLMTGLLIFAGFGFLNAGAAGAMAVTLFLLAFLVLSVFLSVLGCFVTAKIMNISFGHLHTAILKLAAAIIFPTAVSMAIPWVGWLVAIFLYYGLLMWLFELELIEAVVCAAVIWMIRFVSLLLVGTLFIAF